MPATGYQIRCPICCGQGVDEWSVQTWPWDDLAKAEAEWASNNGSASHGSTPTYQPEQLALW